MAGVGTVIAGILIGGTAVGGALTAIDPLKARGGGDKDIERWSDGTLTSVAAANAALVMLGYHGTRGAEDFQRDYDEVLTWHRNVAQGDERVPPADSGFTQVPSALTQLEAESPISINNKLDEATVSALGRVIQAVVYATGKGCMTDQGEVVEAEASQCRDAWREAFTYAYWANRTEPQAPGTGPGAGTGTGMSGGQVDLDAWKQPVVNELQEKGTYGPFLWVTYKDNTGVFQNQFYYVTWRTGVGYQEPTGPFATKVLAKSAVMSAIAAALGQGNVIPKAGVATKAGGLGLGG